MDKNDSPAEFPPFQQTQFYHGWLQVMLLFPERGGHPELLDLAYALYCRLRARHQIEQGVNGDGGCAVPS
jgi:hypothetical protein